MKRNTSDHLNELIDDLEAGRLTRRQLFGQLTALGVMSSSLGGLVRPASASGLGNGKLGEDLVRTGILIRIDDRSDGHYGRVEGIVRPGAAKLSQIDLDGVWRFTITRGEATATIDGRQRTFPEGSVFDVKTGQEFKYFNRSSRPWTFEAELEPAWRPDSVVYKLDGKDAIKGASLWFELKQSVDDTLPRARYLVQDWNDAAHRDTPNRKFSLSGHATADACIVDADPTSIEGPGGPTGGVAFAERHLEMDRLYTVIAGDGTLVLDGQAQRVKRGDTGTISAGVAAQWVASNSRGSLIAEMRPVEPALWVPEMTEWELTPGQFSPGNDIWFEMVFPKSTF